MYDYAGDSLSQVRIAHEPAAWCDSVGFVVKLLRPQLVEVAESSRKHTHTHTYTPRTRQLQPNQYLKFYVQPVLLMFLCFTVLMFSVFRAHSNSLSCILTSFAFIQLFRPLSNMPRDVFKCQSRSPNMVPLPFDMLGMISY